MGTLDHVTLRAGNLAAAHELYDRVFSLLAFTGDRYAEGPFLEWGDFSVAEADQRRPATEGLHIAFTADSPDQVDSWWRELTTAGYSSDGAPGLRPEYSPDYYGAFILDSHGNSVEAVTHGKAREGPPGLIDHLWIRVQDLEPVRRFYTAIAPVVGLELNDRGDRFTLVPDRGIFTFLEGRPTRNLHLAVGVTDQESVERFHQAALAAGGVDNGAPGERPHYHPGYYGAFILDPAGTNIEAVFHDRDASTLVTLDA